MNQDYGRNLDLNLLRVFLTVAERGSVTAAAAQLYLTQPAVSAALGRLTAAVGVPLFARQGRGLVLTSRGGRLLAAVRPHLAALLEAALAPAVFTPASSERTLRLGLSDDVEPWLLPGLLRTLSRKAPQMRLVVTSLQFRTVAEVLAGRRVDAAVTVADDLPASVRRQTLVAAGDFVCLYDPSQVRLPRRLTEPAYFQHDHVVVSYNGDLRGIVEDLLGKTRRARCSVPSFHSVGGIVDGTALLATVPALVAAQIRRVRPHLRTAVLPFNLGGGGVALELLWPSADDDDEAGRFLREEIAVLARRASA
jgi:LysR family transcriptional activator of mexEF-oprN operon